MRVPWQGAPAILDARQKVDEKRLARLCVALARSNALLTAWQALALALVEPELREAIADSEEIAKLDAILGNAPALAAWFEQPVRSAAATELRAMLDSAVALPAVQSASLLQWFDKPVGRLASLASEHLALQLEAHGMRALPFILGVPSSPAFCELASQTSTQLHRLSKSLAEFPMRQLAPSLVDRWIADLYMEGRYVGRARSDVVARGDASESRVRSAPPAPSIAVRTHKADELTFGDDVREPIVERAIDEEWITLADLHALPDDEPRFELPEPEPEIALIRRRSDADGAAPARERRASAHVGLAIFAGVLVGAAATALFMAVAGRDDRRLVPSATGEAPAVVASLAMDLEPAPESMASAGAIAVSAPSPLESVTATPIASPGVTPRITISTTCDLALMYAERGEIAQAIRRFDSCLSPEREWVRQRIGQRCAADVRAKAEKGQCDEAAAIVAQVESIGAAAAAKVAFASLCDSRAREVENETAGP